MAETNTRRQNHPGRSDEDFKPWLDKKAASRVAGKMIMKGCALCGTKESKAMVPDEKGKMVQGETWAAVLDNEGQERFLCLSCAKREFNINDQTSGS